MVYKLNKHGLLKKIKHHILINHPEKYQQINSRLFEESLIYITGFIKCIEVMGEEPIREKDVDQLVFDEIVNYLMKNV